MSFGFATYRDTIRKVSPPWLQNGLAQKILYACGAQLDALGEAAVAAVKMRFPGLYSNETLPFIGHERRIRRGRVDTDDSYAARLRSWLYYHARRGGAHALLEQLHAYFGANAFPIQLVYASGARYSLAADGTITRDVVATALTARWARYSLFYYTDSIDVSDLAELRLLPHEWSAAHVIGTLIVIVSGSELWDYPPARKWNSSRNWNTAPVLRIRVN